MRHSLFFLLAVLFLAGCDVSEKDLRWRQNHVQQIVNTSVYNYTDSNVTEVYFKFANLPFKIEEAAYAGPVYFRNASQTTMDNGQTVYYSSSACCFYWDKSAQPPVSLRIVWQVVYDLDLFEGESGRFDHRTSKAAAPGSRWCEQVIPVRAPYPAQFDNLRLHFMRDGAVVALVGDGKLEQPLSSVEVAAHATPLVKGKYCQHEIDNPWYGIPRKPHRE